MPSWFSSPYLLCDMFVLQKVHLWCAFVNFISVVGHLLPATHTHSLETNRSDAWSSLWSARYVQCTCMRDQLSNLVCGNHLLHHKNYPTPDARPKNLKERNFHSALERKAVQSLRVMLLLWLKLIQINVYTKTQNIIPIGQHLNIREGRRSSNMEYLTTEWNRIKFLTRLSIPK